MIDDVPKGWSRLVLAAAFLLSIEGTVQAEEIRRALELEANGQLIEALHAFELALRRRNNSQDELATIYLHLGVLQLAAGDRAAARQSLDRLLAVNPNPVLPSSAPPEAQRLLEEAASLWNGRRLHAELEVPGSVGEGEGATVRVRVVNDVAGIVDGVAIVSPSADVVAREQGARSPYSVDIPPEVIHGDSEPLSAWLLDEYGGILWEGGEFRVTVEGGGAGAVDAPERQPEPVSTSSSGRRRAFGVSGWTLLAAGLAAAGVGGALVGIDGVETGETQPDPNGILREQYATGTGGWVLIGTGSAALVAAIVLLALRPRGNDNGSTSWRLASALSRGW